MLIAVGLDIQKIKMETKISGTENACVSNQQKKKPRSNKLKLMNSTCRIEFRWILNFVYYIKTNQNRRSNTITNLIHCISS